MTEVAILGFLVGAVLAWGFRVWILVPVTLASLVTLGVWHLAFGSGWPTFLQQGGLTAMALQFGYVFGLFASSLGLLARSQRRVANDNLPDRQPLNHI